MKMTVITGKGGKIIGTARHVDTPNPAWALADQSLVRFKQFR